QQNLAIYICTNQVPRSTSCYSAMENATLSSKKNFQRHGTSFYESMVSKPPSSSASLTVLSTTFAFFHQFFSVYSFFIKRKDDYLCRPDRPSACPGRKQGRKNRSFSAPGNNCFTNDDYFRKRGYVSLYRCACPR